ncbi:MAG TPA: peptidase MA family metallohydrolase [Candidatus Dormibacteraeota bacterium]|nr:peptidase MA family metallohydrolase [Candidatus Dormibacteraeota bacterium]
MVARPRRSGRRARIVALLAAAFMLVVILPARVLATDIAFGSPSATATFLRGIEFDQPLTLATPLDRVELLLTFPGAAGPVVVDVPPPGTTGASTLTYTWVAAADRTLVPNTPITARWRVRSSGSTSAETGPAVTVLYSDTRFTWQSAASGIVRVHWYQGDASFGRRALAIATSAISTAEDALGVTETQPIDFYVYADAAAFRQALGPSTGEFVVGRALPGIRTLFGLVSAGDIGGTEIGVTIAHELTHIVFDTATHNPYHVPPHWLNEGVAKYLSEGYGSNDRGLVASAAGDGTLYPLTSLASAFPSGDAVFLAYAEADAAVDHIVRTRGKAGLARLVDSYAAGLTDDEAFAAALGQDAEAFDAAWLAAVGAKLPSPAGPSAAPPGPLPPGWGSGAAVGTAAPAPSSGNGASAIPGVGTPGSDAVPVAIGAGALGLVALLVILVALRSRRRPAEAVPQGWPSPPEEPSTRGWRPPSEIDGDPDTRSVDGPSEPPPP